MGSHVCQNVGDFLIVSHVLANEATRTTLRLGRNAAIGPIEKSKVATTRWHNVPDMRRSLNGHAIAICTASDWQSLPIPNIERNNLKNGHRPRQLLPRDFEDESKFLPASGELLQPAHPILLTIGDFVQRSGPASLLHMLCRRIAKPVKFASLRGVDGPAESYGMGWRDLYVSFAE